MTTEELEQLLVQQPIALLHRIARGRVQRHFRAGKRRLIEVLLRHSAENRAGFESDLLTLIGEQQARPVLPIPQAPAARKPNRGRLVGSHPTVEPLPPNLTTRESLVEQAYSVLRRRILDAGSRANA